MSRSKKKRPYIKNSDSEKVSKSLANRLFRRVSKIIIRDHANAPDPLPNTIDEETGKVILTPDTYKEKNIPKQVKEVSDNWGWPSDGGAYYVGDCEDVKKYVRK